MLKKGVPIRETPFFYAVMQILAVNMPVSRRVTPLYIRQGF